MRITDHLRIAGTIALLAAGLHVHAQTINAYRYWFDDDGPSVVTTTVAGGQQYTLNNVDAAALPAGYHRITLQFRDSTNAWSVPSTSLFYRNSGNLTAYQYWFDDNVSTLVEMTVGATDVIDITTQINAGALIDGSHTITLRTKDARNGFSVPVTYSFDVITGIAELRGVERVSYSQPRCRSGHPAGGCEPSTGPPTKRSGCFRSHGACARAARLQWCGRARIRPERTTERVIQLVDHQPRCPTTCSVREALTRLRLFPAGLAHAGVLAVRMGARHAMDLTRIRG